MDSNGLFAELLIECYRRTIGVTLEASAIYALNLNRKTWFGFIYYFNDIECLMDC